MVMVRKAMVMLAVSLSTLFLTSNALASEIVYLKCKWVAGKKVEKQMKMIEGEEFDFPVSAEKGFFYYLENGMTEEQKQVTFKAGEKFLEQLGIERENCTAGGLVCRDEKTNEKVFILFSKE
jgi:hypothetical protein